MRRLWLATALLATPLWLAAQQSPSYAIEQGTLNGGGNPSPVLASTSHQMTLDSIGDSVAATGLASASNAMDAGLPPDYRPPGEVLDLRLSLGTALAWRPEPSVGSYNLYRGDITSLPAAYGTKVQSGLATAAATDATNPAPGQCLFYLVTATNRLAEEGTKGKDSAGNPRP